MKRNTLLYVIALVAVAFILYQAFVAFGMKTVRISWLVAAEDTLTHMPITPRRVTVTQRVPFWAEDPVPPEMVSVSGCATRIVRANEILTTDMVEDCEGYQAVSVPVPTEYNSPVLPVGTTALYCYVPLSQMRDCARESCIPNAAENYPPQYLRRSLETNALANNLPPGTFCVTGVLGQPLNNNGQVVRLCDKSDEGAGRTVVAPDAMPAMQTSGAPISSNEDECREETPVGRILVVPANAIASLARMVYYEETGYNILLSGNIPMINDTLIFLSTGENGSGRWFLVGDIPPWGNVPEIEDVETGEVDISPVSTPTPEPTPTPIPEVTVPTIITDTSGITDTNSITDTVIAPSLEITSTIPVSPSLVLTATVNVDRLNVRMSPVTGNLVGYLFRDTEIEVIAFNGDYDDPWVAIRTDDISGWVSYLYLSPDDLLPTVGEGE